MKAFKDLTNMRADKNPDEVSPDLLDDVSGGVNPEGDDEECCGSLRFCAIFDCSPSVEVQQ